MLKRVLVHPSFGTIRHRSCSGSAAQPHPIQNGASAGYMAGVAPPGTIPILSSFAPAR
jgi:hypothetical protein